MNPKKANKVKTGLIEWLKAILYALIFGLIIRIFVFESMMVPTPSMVPTIEVGDRIFIEKITTQYAEIKNGDVLAFWTPFVDKNIVNNKLRTFDKIMDLFAPKEYDGHAKYLKRLVAQSGDKLKLIPISEERWKQIFNNEVEYPYWIKNIINSYQKYEYIPLFLRSKVSQLYINGKIPEGFENNYYTIEGIFENKNFYKYMAYPSKYEDNINSEKIMTFSYDNFNDKFRYGSYTIEFFNYYNENNDFDGLYESLSKDVDMENLAKVDSDGLIYLEIPEGYCYFMGDNTVQSFDSRYFGIVPEKNIIGYPFLRFWPFNRIGSPN